MSASWVYRISSALMGLSTRDSRVCAQLVKTDPGVRLASLWSRPDVTFEARRSELLHCYRRHCTHREACAEFESLGHRDEARAIRRIIQQKQKAHADEIGPSIERKLPRPVKVFSGVKVMI